MRTCASKRSISLLQKRDHGTLKASPGSRPRAIKQLSNAELLNLVQEGNSNTDIRSGANGSKDHDNLTRGLSGPKSGYFPPHSPLTEPQLVAARARRRKEKAPPGIGRSPFQLKLQKNPYARALSTPPRLCLLTGIRLPIYFLIPFGVAKHPKTGAPWHLPRLSNLMNQSGANPTITSPSSPPQSNLDSISNPPIRTASGTHFVATHEALAHVSNLAKPAYRRMMPYRWKEDPSLKIPDIVWREDMATFVLDMLRKSAVRGLKYLASRPAAYVAACKSYDDISSHGQVAAILWLGSDDVASAQETSSSEADEDRECGPPPYAMHYYKGHYIPYFNLVTLLERTHLRSLREVSSAQLAGRLAVVKAKRPTVKFQLELWKLLGFLSRPSREGTKKEKMPDLHVQIS